LAAVFWLFAEGPEKLFFDLILDFSLLFCNIAPPFQTPEIGCFSLALGGMAVVKERFLWKCNGSSIEIPQ
jgi:hypothetical protein